MRSLGRLYVLSKFYLSARNSTLVTIMRILVVETRSLVSTIVTLWPQVDGAGCFAHSRSFSLMFSTSLTALALSTLLASGIPTPTTWQPDYRSAVLRAATDKKPLAVFLVKDVAAVKSISAAALDRLNREYVAVIVNTGTASGKTLAMSFEMTEGLVISDITGEKQAFRHVGSIPTVDLPSTLERFAHVSQVVTATETQGIVVYAEPVAPVYYPQATRPTPIRNIVGATLNVVGSIIPGSPVCRT